MYYTLFIFVVVCSFTAVVGNLASKLHYFETLKPQDVHVITKRSIDTNPDSHLKLVHLQGLGKQFNFYLHSTQRLLSSDFSASTVDSDGHETPVFINRNAFYEGALQDEEGSHVDAVWEGEDMLATITTPGETYTVEPSWRHLPGSSNHTMIIYKGSDIKSLYNNTGHHRRHFCGYQPGVTLTKEELDRSQRMKKFYQESEYNESHSLSHSYHHHRQRRSAALKNTCEMLLVADYTYFKGIGESNSLKTANYLIHIMTKVDSIFRNTVWDEGSSGNLKGYGLKIKKVKIHSQYSNDESSYNKNKKWTYKNLLDKFSSSTELQKYCLGHLFTYQKFQDGVLGLAYISSSRENTVGGICSPMYYSGESFLTLNTGWSSSMNTEGFRTLSQEAQIVTTHGHNWGSEHDPGEGDCAPSSFGGGKYIMYPYAVSGYEKNNWKFSSCSKTFVKDVLRTKSRLCFTTSTVFEFCGNGNVDPNKGEECDDGFLHNSVQSRHCCNRDCTLSPGSRCSPLNHECCTPNCQIAPKGTMCRSVLGDSSDCLKNSSCNGFDFHCPKPEFKDDNTNCLDGGKCMKGKCLSFCEARTLRSCICDNVNDTCFRCCSGEDNICKPYDKVYKLRDGRPCHQGYCVQGVCKKVVRNTIQRLFDIFEKMIISDFGEFMKANIVTTVIIFSMFLWIPFSCYISHYDRKEREKDEAYEAWHHHRNQEFFQRPPAPLKFKVQEPSAARYIAPPPATSYYVRNLKIKESTI
ncbi:ADAM 17-like protease [Argonauta hians]